VRHELILLVVFVLAGCSPDHAKDLAACGEKADRFFQGYNTADVSNPRGQYVIGCMAAKGYDFDVSPVACDSRHSLVMQPACYVDRGWMAWIISRVRAHGNE